MPSLTGQLGVVLSVRDAARSARWYGTVLGLQERYSHLADDASTHYVCLEHPGGVLELCLVSHAGNPGEPFNERRSGLDHLELLVACKQDLVEWAEHLDLLGIPHSGVKELSYTRNSMLTFRTPTTSSSSSSGRHSPPPAAP